MPGTTVGTYKHPCQCHVKLAPLSGRFSSGVNGLATAALLIVPGTYVLVTSETRQRSPVHVQLQKATHEKELRVPDLSKSARSSCSGWQQRCAQHSGFTGTC